MVQASDIRVGLTVRYLNGFGDKHPLGIISEIDPQKGHFKVTVADRSVAFWSNPTSFQYPLSDSHSMEAIPSEEFLAYVTSLQQKHLEAEKAASEALEAQLARMRRENAAWRANMDTLGALIAR